MMTELLAPAGNWECAVTAFEAGADAVYAGLARFNARERNRNFTYEEMSRLSRYAKDHGKKFYVTMNTLIKDSEIGDFTDELEALSRLDPDALILQDLGALKICRDFFPEFRIHASTQMGIHNSAGLRTAAKLGVSRVILERQLLFDEIAAMAKDRPTELEVFIHGALCCSLSGMCHFSSIQGGFSGNRGKCKQPCRRLYRNGEGQTAPFFSPDDLRAVSLIHSFKEIGIESYKIEGRLKRADYVRQTVTAYRLLLDGDASDLRLQREASRILQGGAVRSSGTGFYSDDSRAALLGRRSVQAGEAAAETVSVSGSRWTAKSLTEIHRGDKLRLPENAGAGIVTLTDIESDGRKVAAVRANRLFSFTVRSGCSGDTGRKRVFAGTVLYRVGSQSGKSAEALERMKRYDERRPLPLTVRLDGEGLTVSVTGKPETGCRFPYEAEAAQNAPVTVDDLVRLFSHSGGRDWKAGAVTGDVTAAYFVPVSVRKQWRRQLEQMWEEAPVHSRPRREAVLAAAARFAAARFADETVTAFGSRRTPDGSPALRCDPIGRIGKETDEVVLPFFLPEPQTGSFQTVIDKAAACGVRRFRLTSLWQLAFRYPHNAVLTAAHPLPAANAFAARLLAESGCGRIQIWPELGEEEAALAYESFGCVCERFVFGSFPVLATRAALPEGDYIAAETESSLRYWQATADAVSGCVLLYPKADVSAKRVAGCGSFYAENEFSEKFLVSFPSMS